MIEGISQLGGLLLRSDDSSYIDLLIQPIKLDKKEQHLIGINFDTQSKTIEFKILRKITQKNAGANNPQLRLTTNQISYF